MPDIFSTPDDTADIQASDVQSSLGEQLGAEAKNALDPQDSLSAAWIYRRAREGIAGGYAPHDWDGLPGAAGITLDNIEDQARAQIPSLPVDQARQRVKDAGLEGHVTLPPQDEIKQPVLDLMMQEAQERRDREAAIARGPQGFYPDALGTITSIGAGMLDPVNAAAFSIPVVGEARWGKIIANAGDSIAARAALNAGKGAAQGGVGTAVLQPADWWLHTRDGQDYTFADVLKQVTLGAAMGGVAHAGIGAIGDVLARRRGSPLPGSPADLLARGQLAGVHVPGEALGEQGATADHIAEILGLPSEPPAVPEPAEQIHPAELYSDLPPAAQQDALRVTMADMINGDLPQPMEMLETAADYSPRIAESFDAYHGSPHDFDRFDLTHIGEGEGAQAYGHGLYFAENEGVAKSYSEMSPLTATGTEDLARQTYLAAGEDRKTAVAQLRDFASRNPNPTNEKMQLAAADFLDSGAPIALPKLYKVRIKAHQDHFLDWDKPLGEQSEHVRKALLEHPDQSISGTAAKWGHNIGHLYNRLSQRLTEHVDESGERWGTQGPSVASKALQEAGIPGIKYLDRGSRGIRTPAEARVLLQSAQEDLARDPTNRQLQLMVRQIEKQAAEPEPTRNFVVFNDKDVEITHKNGEPVKREELLAERLALRGEMPSGENPAAAPARSVTGDTLARDQAFARLGDRPPAYDAPEEVENSRWADNLPEPASLDPKRSATALQQAVDEAEQIWRDIEPYLSEEERRVFNDALEAVDRDAAANAQVLKEGAACLAAAVG